MSSDNSSSRDTRNPAEHDRALQADPELDLSGGRATVSQIALVALGSFAIIMLVLYGLNNQRDEIAVSEPASTAVQSPQPDQAQTSSQSTNSSATQNAQQGETTGSGAKTRPESPATGRADSSQEGAPATGK